MKFSPEHLDSKSQFLFKPAHNLAEFYSQFVILKRHNKSIVGSQRELPISDLVRAIDEAVSSVKAQQKDNHHLSEKQLDHTLASYGITRANNIRASLQTTISNMFGSGEPNVEGPIEAQLFRYLTDTLEFHPINRIPEDKFREDFPRNIKSTDKDLQAAVERRWMQLEANEKAITAGELEQQQEQTKRDIIEWQTKRQLHIFNENEVIAINVSDEKSYQTLIKENRHARKQYLNHAQELNNSPYSITSSLSEIANKLANSKVRKTAFEYNGINKVLDTQGREHNVLAKTRVFELGNSVPKSTFSLSLLSSLNEGRWENPEDFSGTVLEIDQVAGQSSREISELLQAQKKATGRINASTVLKPEVIAHLLQIKDWLKAYEKVANDKTGIVLWLARSFEDNYGL